MTTLPRQPLTPQEQRHRLDYLYLRMGDQVKSYHKTRHMGENSSVPVELARDLMASMLYTLEQTGESDPALGLEKGLTVLEEKLSRARQLFRLVEATTPLWQGECRCEALGYLAKYLDRYDPVHLAHRAPELLYYPLLLEVPQTLTGIDAALFFLTSLWQENQLMDGFSEEDLEEFWSVFCQNDRGLSENQCRRLLVNAAGKGLLPGSTGLTFSLQECQRLEDRLSGLTPEQLSVLMEEALTACLGDSPAAEYGKNALTGLSQQLTAALATGNLHTVFL